MSESVHMCTPMPGTHRIIGSLQPIIFITLAVGSHAAHITNLEAPTLALAGDSIHLRCSYDHSDGSQLYSLKWYKDGYEFFRHVPSNEGPSAVACEKRVIPVLPGVAVECWLSSEKEVVLTDTTKATSGKYKCEVISDNPSFRKEAKEATVRVYGERLQVPVIEERPVGSRVLTGLNLSCSSRNREYRPRLSWHLNGVPLDQGEETPGVVVTERRGGAVLELQLHLQSSHFVAQGKAVAVCRASMGHHVRESAWQIEDPSLLTAEEFLLSAGVQLLSDCGATKGLPLLFCLAVSLLSFLQEGLN